MKMKRAVMIAVLAVAVAALAVPLLGLRTHAASGADAKASAAPRAAAVAATATNPLSLATADKSSSSEPQADQSGIINPEVIKSLGIRRLPKGTDMQAASQKVAKQIAPNAQVRTVLPPGTGPAGASPVTPGVGNSTDKGRG
jgi:hypothetical protein